MIYLNKTPTFDLTPVEKPDLSPFLIHMTGKKSLVSILKGDNKPEGDSLSKECGYLKAVVPSYDGLVFYDSKVVCFTESPIFALDFFRQRSLRRKQDDQQYGIGFLKSNLVKQGVRPVLYLDTKTNTSFLNFCNKVISKEYQIINKKGFSLDFSEFFARIKPLLFPILEDSELQGFMWEREWRYPNEKGLIFPYSAIKVICCPKDERDEVLGVLGESVSGIDLVESWREYDEVTNYFERRKKETNQKDLIRISEINDFTLLGELKRQNDETLNVLKKHYYAYKETVISLEEKSNINLLIEQIEVKSKEINDQLKKVMEERKKEMEGRKKSGQ